MFQSNTYGVLGLSEVAEKLLMFFEKTAFYDTSFQLAIGTDSQNFDQTKIVTVIAGYREGHGGVFFYEIAKVPRITNVAQKLTEETSRSLTIATELAEILEADKKYKKLRDDCRISIHVDAGWSEKGKTKELIPGLVGWIRSLGYQAAVKPGDGTREEYPYAASSVADNVYKGKPRKENRKAA